MFFFGYNKYQEVEFEKNKLQAKQKENIGSNSRSISEISNNENQSNESPSNSQEKTQTTTHETAKNQQKVTRDNVFDYAIAAINKVGNADLLKFQEPEYNGSEWTINANNKPGAGANTIVVKDDGTVQIWNGPKTAIDYETKIEL